MQKARIDEVWRRVAYYHAVMTVPQLSPQEAFVLLSSQGYRYLDVRSEVEFLAGHPPGALNVPFRLVHGDRLVDNPQFAAVMTANFEPAERLLVGCHSGSRSRLCTEVLQGLGFCSLAELATGFDGRRGAFGRLEPGWARLGMPVETHALEWQTYDWHLQRVVR